MKFIKKIFTAAFFLFPLASPLASFSQESDSESRQYCNNIPAYYEQILAQVTAKNPDAISNLPECFRLNRALILNAVFIDPAQFQNAADLLREDEIFVMRLLKISPQVLQYAAPEIRNNPDFMTKATYLSRDALQYAGWKLLDNKLFMKKMIEIDSRNYKFASDRLKEIPEFIIRAFLDNGLLLEFAPPKIRADKKFVKIAVESNHSAIAFASDALKEDKDLQKIVKQKTSIKSPEDLRKFLEENYIANNPQKNLGRIFANQGKNFPQNKIIQRNYVTKWQKSLDFYRVENGHVGEDTRLITADSRNYQISWRDDFKKYPDLVKKIEKFFRNHNLADNTIENLSTSFLWKVKSKPLTFVFNLYLLRESTEASLGPDFADITSLTAIVQKCKNKWCMTVVEVIFDSEVKVDIAYENGHRQYALWDLYLVDKNDKNPKIIFKVDDRFGQHFEVFEEQGKGKYQMIYASENFTKKR